MQIGSRSFSVILLLCVAIVTPAQENLRVIVGRRYHNPAEGFSVRVPQGFKGIAGDQAGPERGVTILLGENRVINVYGEPNSLEWKDAAQAIRFAIKNQRSGVSNARMFHSRLGSLVASRAILQSVNRALEIAVAFRPGGGPVYWVDLESDRRHFSHDHTVFMSVVRSFQIEAWK